MGQVIAQIDETGVNQLFVKVFNQVAAQPFEASQSAGFQGVSASVSVQGRAEPVDFAATAMPINLLGSSQSPPVRFAGTRFKLPTRITATLNVQGWSRSVSLDLQVEVTLGGGASVSLQTRPEDFLAQLSLQPDSASVSFAGQRDALVAAARESVRQIDTNPHWPGTQRPPQAVIDAAGEAVRLAFDAVRGPAEQLAGEVATSQLARIRLDLGLPVPRRLRQTIPDLGTVQVSLSQPSIVIEPASVRLSASFS